MRAVCSYVKNKKRKINEVLGIVISYFRLNFSLVIFNAILRCMSGFKILTLAIGVLNVKALGSREGVS